MPSTADVEANAALLASREAVLAILEESIRQMAAVKAVPFAPEAISALALQTIEHMDAPILLGLTKADQASVTLVAATLNTAIDLMAAKEVIALIWQVEGFDDLDHAWLSAQAYAWVGQPFVTPSGIDNRFRWPDPLVMVKDYFRVRSGMPVRVMLPDSSKRLVGFFLDRVRCRVAADRGERLAIFNPDAGQGSRLPGPVPQIIRCPGLFCTPLFQFPDGRCLKKFPDGKRLTTWWKNGKLHRDPAEGPAWQCLTSQGESFEYAVMGTLHRDPAEGPASSRMTDGILRAEYRVHGELHREDGPALVERDCATGKTLSECYYRNGEMHRDDGPASLSRDKTGRITLEYWFRNGNPSRDPKDGPAKFRCDEQGRIEQMEYFVDGERHRDPEDGPAELWRDPDDGRVYTHYWVDGRLHRDPSQGPAVIECDSAGRVIREAFWQHGEFIDDIDPPPENRRARRAAKKQGRKASRRRS